jgi:electron transfer flavoprotein alpha subunit
MVFPMPSFRPPAQLVKKSEPAVVLIGATSLGKDIAARLSARLDAPLAMDCVDVRLEGDQVVATRPMYGGKVLADVSLTPALRPSSPSAPGLWKRWPLRVTVRLKRWRSVWTAPP